jgi:hypothetical protein
LLLNLFVLADDQQARHYCGLMYVQPTTAFDQSLHNASIGGDCCAAGLGHCHASFPFAGATKGPARVSLIDGICVIT